MIRRLGQLDTVSIRLIFVHKSILSATQETFKTIPEQFIVIVHVCPAWPASWDFVDWLLNRFHVIRDGRNYYTKRHSEPIVQWCIMWHVCVRELILAGVALGISSELFVLWFELCLLLGHFMLLRFKVRAFVTLWNASLQWNVSLILSLFKDSVDWHFVYDLFF